MALGFAAQKLFDLISTSAGDVVGVIFYVLGMLGLTAGLIVLWIMLPKVMRDAISRVLG